MLVAGGEDEIRTHGTIARTHAFQACAFNHSATSPRLYIVDKSSRSANHCFFHAINLIAELAKSSHTIGNAQNKDTSRYCPQTTP